MKKKSQKKVYANDSRSLQDLVMLAHLYRPVTLLTLTFHFALEPWGCVKFNTPLKDQYRLSFFYSIKGF